MKKRFKILEEYQEDCDIYAEEGVHSFQDNDEISDVESGFMIGYLAA
jgi:hypothetical protein